MLTITRVLLLLPLLSVSSMIPPSSTSHARFLVVQPQSVTPIDRWLTHPAVIVLTKEQQGQVDSLRVRYLTERNKLREQGTDQGEMAAVIQQRSQDEKYLPLLRNLLTPQQKLTLDKNIQLGSTFPKPPNR